MYIKFFASALTGDKFSDKSNLIKASDLSPVKAWGSVHEYFFCKVLQAWVIVVAVQKKKLKKIKKNNGINKGGTKKIPVSGRPTDLFLWEK